MVKDAVKNETKADLNAALKAARGLLGFSDGAAGGRRNASIAAAAGGLAGLREVGKDIEEYVAGDERLTAYAKNIQNAVGVPDIIGAATQIEQEIVLRNAK